MIVVWEFCDEARFLLMPCAIISDQGHHRNVVVGVQ